MQQLTAPKPITWNNGRFTVTVSIGEVGGYYVETRHNGPSGRVIDALTGPFPYEDMARGIARVIAVTFRDTPGTMNGEKAIANARAAVREYLGLEIQARLAAPGVPNANIACQWEQAATMFETADEIAESDAIAARLRAELTARRDRQAQATGKALAADPVAEHMARWAGPDAYASRVEAEHGPAVAAHYQRAVAASAPEPSTPTPHTAPSTRPVPPARLRPGTSRKLSGLMVAMLRQMATAPGGKIELSGRREQNRAYSLEKRGYAQPLYSTDGVPASMYGAQITPSGVAHLRHLDEMAKLGAAVAA